jgi:hypothetical protein
VLLVAERPPTAAPPPIVDERRGLRQMSAQEQLVVSVQHSLRLPPLRRRSVVHAGEEAVEARVIAELYGDPALRRRHYQTEPFHPWGSIHRWGSNWAGGAPGARR